MSFHYTPYHLKPVQRRKLHVTKCNTANNCLAKTFEIIDSICRNNFILHFYWVRIAKEGKLIPEIRNNGNKIFMQRLTKETTFWITQSLANPLMVDQTKQTKVGTQFVANWFICPYQSEKLSKVPVEEGRSGNNKKASWEKLSSAICWANILCYRPILATSESKVMPRRARCPS